MRKNDIAFANFVSSAVSSKHLGIADPKIEVRVRSNTTYQELVDTTYQDRPVYRFAFNSQERDDEIRGVGNQYNYQARIFDPRLSRFLSIDPLTRGFPWWSPYHFAGNTPIQAIDLDGLEILDYKSVWYATVTTVKLANGSEKQIIGRAQRGADVSKVTDLSNSVVVVDQDKAAEVMNYWNTAGNAASAENKETIVSESQTEHPAKTYGGAGEMRQAANEGNNTGANAAAGGVLFYSFMKNLSESSSLPAKLDAEDNTRADAALQASFVAVSMYDSELKKIAKTLDVDSKYGRDRLKADVINYVVDHHSPETTDQKYIFAVMTIGEKILSDSDLNLKLESSKEAGNVAKEVYLEVTN